MRTTSHARSRWDERTPDTTLSLNQAWHKATCLDHVTEFFAKETNDEARIYNGVTPTGTRYKMLLFSENGEIQTTYPYSGASDNRVEQYVEKMLDHTVFYE